MKIKIKFRTPQIDLIFLAPTILLYFRNSNAPIAFIFGISIDWLWWQIAIAFEKQKGEKE